MADGSPMLSLTESPVRNYAGLAVTGEVELEGKKPRLGHARTLAIQRSARQRPVAARVVASKERARERERERER